MWRYWKSALQNSSSTVIHTLQKAASSSENTERRWSLRLQARVRDPQTWLLRVTEDVC